MNTNETTAAIDTWIHRQHMRRVLTASRLSAEIIAAVTTGEELPDEWYTIDSYAGVGEPESMAVASMVREELEGTGINP